MFESSKRHFQGPEQKERLSEDQKISKEINEMEEKDYKKKGLEIDNEFRNEVEKLRKDEDKAIKIVGFVNRYVENNSDKLSKKMSLDEFLDFINEDERKFGLVIKNMINIWVDEHKEEIDFEETLDNFLESVKKIGDEVSHLLNPGPEDTKTEN